MTLRDRLLREPQRSVIAFQTDEDWRHYRQHVEFVRAAKLFQAKGKIYNAIATQRAAAQPAAQ